MSTEKESMFFILKQKNKKKERKFFIEKLNFYFQTIQNETATLLSLLFIFCFQIHEMRKSNKYFIPKIYINKQAYLFVIIYRYISKEEENNNNNGSLKGNINFINKIKKKRNFLFFSLFNHNKFKE